MSCRVELVNGDVFNAREWLRRDVLWASLMSPYSRQLAGWLDGTQEQQHNGNVSRQLVYGSAQDVESQSMAFFNQGKNIAGLISSVALFKSCMPRSNDGCAVTPIEVQAKSIDAVLGSAFDSNTAEGVVYAECAHLVAEANKSRDGEFGKRQRLLRASKLMTGLATQEAVSWLAQASQNEDSSLPILSIQNGGHPRSAGPRVEMLQPIFETIIASPKYQSLSTS